MKLSVLVALSVFLTAVACSEDPTTSDEYLLLSSEASSLSAELSDLEDQVLGAETQLASHQADRQKNEDLSQSIQAEIDTANAHIEASQNQIPELAAELSLLTEQTDVAKGEIAAVEAALREFKTSSSRWRSAVRQTIADHRRYNCQQDWKQDLSGLIPNLDVNDLAPNVGRASEFSTSDMSLVDTSHMAADCGREGYENIFGSAATVLNRICETVNIDKLKKDPSSYSGQCFRGRSAYVVQFDTNTGPLHFHANLGSRFGDRVEFELTQGLSGEELYEGVRFNWYAVGDGVLSYSTTSGGTNTIPSFKLVWIT